MNAFIKDSQPLSIILRHNLPSTYVDDRIVPSVHRQAITNTLQPLLFASLHDRSQNFTAPSPRRHRINSHCHEILRQHTGTLSRCSGGVMVDSELFSRKVSKTHTHTYINGHLEAPEIVGEGKRWYCGANEI